MIAVNASSDSEKQGNANHFTISHVVPLIRTVLH